MYPIVRINDVCNWKQPNLTGSFDKFGHFASIARTSEFRQIKSYDATHTFRIYVNIIWYEM